jgi:hypothetical protein
MLGLIIFLCTTAVATIGGMIIHTCSPTREVITMSEFSKFCETLEM